ncbi:hypothetical protein GJ496_011371 [Pomphorhynchus laevis]|nr:hypothetical protein GJ496_011371 [Pomphorhynchus laevis]
MRQLTFVSSNKNKIKEFVSIMKRCPDIEVVTADIDLPELQGEPDFIVKEKCRTAMKTLGQSVVVEDTSLCFNALGGLPGPYIKWFLKALRPEGLYRLLHGFEDKSAYATCTLAFGNADTSEIKLFTGQIDGEIVEPKGVTTFGWDPCFKPYGQNKTFGEMTIDEKNSISHRSKALHTFSEYFINTT